MIIVKNDGAMKTINIDGINTIILPGIGNYKKSIVLEKAAKLHPDLTLLDSVTGDSVQDNGPSVEQVNEVPEESISTIASEDVAVNTDTADSQVYGKKKHKKNKQNKFNAGK